MQPSSQWRPMNNKGKQFENQFFIYEPWGGLQWSDWAYLAFQLSSHPYPCACQIRKQSDQKFETQNMKKYILFLHILGVLGGPMSNPGEQKFQGRNFRPHHRADICITRGKNNGQFFIYGPQYIKICIFCYSGGPGWPKNNRTGPILLPSYPLTSIYI